MKTKWSLLVMLCVFFVVGAFGTNPEKATYSNIQETATGSIKEFTTFNKENNQPLQKTLYKYNLAGNIEAKIIYKWSGSDKGWVGNQKHEYVYDEANPDQPLSIIYTKWDERKSDWSQKTQKIEANSITFN